MLDLYTHERVHELRLDRPPANALTPELIETIRTALDQSLKNGAEAIVLSAAGRMFSGGLDVPHLLALDRDGILHLWREFYGLLRDLAVCPVPVAAAISGHAPAGGAVMAMFCDRRVMAEGAAPDKPFKIGLNEVQVGLPLPPLIYRALVHVVGERQAGRMCMEGLMLTAVEAHAVGFVDQVTTPDEVFPAALAWCQRVLALPRVAMLHTRALARADLVKEFDRGFEEVASLADIWFHPSTQAGLQALVESLQKKR